MKPCQSRTVSKDNEGVHHSHWGFPIRYSLMSLSGQFLEGVLSLSRVHCKHILSPADWKEMVGSKEWSWRWMILFHNVFIIIIIMLCHQHKYLWPSLTTPPYHSSHLAGLQGYIPYPHRAAVSRFKLVTLLLLGHVRESIGEHHLWARSCLSSSVLYVWFV